MKLYDQDESYSIISFENHTDEEAIQLRMKLMDDLSVFVDGYKWSPKFKAGIWDGKKHFYKMLPNLNIQIPKGLAESIAKRYVQYLEEPYTPLRTPPEFTQEEIDEHIASLELPFEMRDYQKEAFIEILKNPRRILVAATSSGKSLIIYVTMTLLEKKGYKGILIVPDVGLVNQMYSDFESYGMKNMDERVHKIHAGLEKTFRYPITITTWQSAILMRKAEFDQLDYLIIDEAHKAQAESLQTLIAYARNSLWKVGVTGTLPKNAESRFALAAALGKSKKIITPQEMIERGYSTPVEIVLVYLNYSDEDKRKVHKHRDSSGKLRKMTYQEEVKFIEEHYKRNDFVAKLVYNASRKYGNSLVIYNHIQHGEFLLELILKQRFGISNIVILEKITKQRIEKALPKLETLESLFTLTKLSDKDKKVLRQFFPEEEIAKVRDLDTLGIYLFRGSVEGETRNKIRAILEEKSDAILIGSVKTVSTGINIKRIHAIFNATQFKSSITLNQAIGRGMRKHEEKSVVRWFDIIDDMSTKTKTGKVRNKNYALKHSYERLNEYLDHGYPIKEIEVEL